MELATLSRKETAKRRKRKRVWIGIFMTLILGIMIVSLYANEIALTKKVYFDDEKPDTLDTKVGTNAEVETRGNEQSEIGVFIPVEIKVEEIESVVPLLAEVEPVIAEESTTNSSVPTQKEKQQTIEKHKTVKEEKEKPSNQGMIILEHVVKKKETIFSISRLYYEKNEVDYLLHHNKIQDPEVQIKEGMVLSIPNPTYLSQHKVQKGETLYQIVKTYYSKANLLTYLGQFNGINNPQSDVKNGMKLNVFQEHGLIEHTVKPKETLFSVMSTYYKFSSFLSLMKDSNQITDDVEAGEVLKIRNPYQTQTQFTTTDTRWNIEIILSQNKLMVYKNGEKYKTSTVATGKDSLTPKGNFKIITKISNPGYTPKNIPGGDPENPLGTRWLGLNVQGTTGRTYGIHGTSDPTSLGKYVSNGCIRLENSIIEELYNILPVGTTVVIK